jgi:hypothetical protein
MTTGKFLEKLLQLFVAVATIFGCYVAVLTLSRPEAREALLPFSASNTPEIREVTREIPVTVIAERIITATPQPDLPTFTAVATPSVQEEVVLYQADWSNGLNGWPSGFGWSALGGMLVNDGSNRDRPPWKHTWVTAPYEPSTTDYAVEAEIQVIRVEGNCGSYGVTVRSGYQVGVVICGSPGVTIIGQDVGELGTQSFSPGTDWHTYRAEVQGNEIKAIVDGVVLLRVADNRHLLSGEVGLWVDTTQLNVRAFKVTGL